jgi:16S rRNA (guanine527-N7)-methyltransferase
MLEEGRLVARLRNLGQAAGLTLDKDGWSRLGRYVELLLRWNERMNLTALNDGDRGLERLVIEPLLASRHVPLGATSMVDIGSGGGSPAIPIKIGRPELLVRMVESRSRKAGFLRHAVRALNLSGAAVENCRYEGLAQRPGMRQAHDVLTLRGVRIDGAVRACLGLLREEGLVLVFRSEGQSDVEADAGSGLKVEKRTPLMQGTGAELIVARKVRVR